VVLGTACSLKGLIASTRNDSEERDTAQAALYDADTARKRKRLEDELNTAGPSRPPSSNRGSISIHQDKDDDSIAELKDRTARIQTMLQTLVDRSTQVREPSSSLASRPYRLGHIATTIGKMSKMDLQDDPFQEDIIYGRTHRNSGLNISAITFGTRDATSFTCPIISGVVSMSQMEQIYHR
jgi:hypothetical protein